MDAQAPPSLATTFMVPLCSILTLRSPFMRLVM
jgi:hypothetical protein